jgi:IS5 family transposase
MDFSAEVGGKAGDEMIPFGCWAEDDSMRQASLIEALIDPRLGSNERLARIDALINWTSIAAIVGTLRDGSQGRPPYDALMMVKALYLQALYDLSDPGLEAALLDRLSFRRFCGLSLDASTPDETTILRFRHDAAEAEAMQACFAEINRQLEAKGFVLKKGTLMDATLVAATHNPPKIAAGPGAGHPRERGAPWTKKNGRSHFGYKAHVAMDQGSGLIRRAVLTGAKTYESEVADQLISWDERAVYGDKAYPKKARRAALKEAGIKDRIAKRRHKSEPPLSPRQKRRNDLIARDRAPVEGVFSQMKRFYGWSRTRCHTLARNAADLFAILSVFNLKRAVHLVTP